MAKFYSRLRGHLAANQFEASFVIIKLVVAALALVSSVAGIRIAGSHSFGVYAATIAICSLGGLSAGGWIGQGLLRFQVFATLPIRQLLTGSWHRQLIFVVPVAVAGFIAVVPLSAQGTPVPIAASLTIVVSGMFALLSVAISRSMVARRAGAVGILEGGRAIAMGGAVATEPAALSAGLPPLVGPLLVCSVVLAIAMAAAHSSPVREASAGDVDGLRRMTLYAAPLALWLLLGGLYQNLDRVLLERLVTAAEAGEYAFIYDVANRGVLLPVTAVATSLHVRVLGQYDRDGRVSGRRINRKIVQVQRAVSVGLMVLALPVLWAGTRVFGAFEASHAVIAGLVFAAGIVWADAINVQREVQGAGHSAPLLRALVLAVVANVGLTLAAIPIAGAVGAAAATLASAVVYDSLVIRRVRIDGHLESSE
jgi:O-antigen/teichoic acid export membrane protein